MTRADLIIIGFWIGGLAFALVVIGEVVELWDRFQEWRARRRYVRDVMTGRQPLFDQDAPEISRDEEIDRLVAQLRHPSNPSVR